MRNLWCIYIFLLWRRFQTHRFIAAHLALNASKALVKISSITKTALSAFHRCQKICVNEQPKSVWWSTIKWQFNWIYECDSETASYIYDCFVLFCCVFFLSRCVFFRPVHVDFKFTMIFWFSISDWNEFRFTFYCFNEYWCANILKCDLHVEALNTLRKVNKQQQMNDKTQLCIYAQAHSSHS